MRNFLFLLSFSALAATPKVAFDGPKVDPPDSAEEKAKQKIKDDDAEACRFWTMVAIRLPKLTKESTDGDVREAITTLLEKERFCAR